MKLYQRSLKSIMCLGTLTVLMLSAGNTSAQPPSTSSEQRRSDPAPQPIIYAEPIDFSCDLRDQRDRAGNVLKKNVPTTVASVNLEPALQKLGFVAQDTQVERSTAMLARQTTAQPSEKSLPDKVVIYHWLENYADDGETALMRCRRVAAVLSDIKQQNSFHLITVGEMNGRRVLCVASKQDGPCSRLIFPLKPQEQSKEASEEILKDFLEALKGLALTVRSAKGDAAILLFPVNGVVREQAPQRRSQVREALLRQLRLRYQISPSRNIPAASR